MAKNTTPEEREMIQGEINNYQNLLDQSDHQEFKWLRGELTDDEIGEWRTKRGAWAQAIRDLREELEDIADGGDDE